MKVSQASSASHASAEYEIVRRGEDSIAGGRSGFDRRFTTIDAKALSVAGRSIMCELKEVIAAATAPSDKGGYTTRSSICEKLGVKHDRVDRWMSVTTAMLPTAVELFELCTNARIFNAAHRQRLIKFVAASGGMIAIEPVGKDEKSLELQVCEVTGELGAVGRLLTACRARDSAGGTGLTGGEKRLLTDCAAEAIRELQEFMVSVAKSDLVPGTRFKEARRAAAKGLALFDFLFVTCVIVLFTGAAVIVGPLKAALWFALAAMAVCALWLIGREIGKMFDAADEAGAIRLGNQSKCRL